MKNIRRAIYVSKMLSENGVNVVGSFITPYLEQRKIIRKNFKKRYIEIFVDAPLTACQKRDTKNHYKKAKNGQIENFTGISDVYERPENCEIHLYTNKNNAGACHEKIVGYLIKTNGFQG